MAFTGLHVVAAYAGSSVMRYASQPILGRTIWSESPSSGVTTTNAAPETHDTNGQALFRIRAAADSWVSIGKTPNATSGTRLLAPAGHDVDVFVEFGDRLQWVAA